MTICLNASALSRYTLLSLAPVCFSVFLSLLPLSAATIHKSAGIKRTVATSKVSSNADFDAANSLAGREHYDEALVKYKLAVAAQPTNPKVFHMYGRTLALLGRFDESIEQYRQALALSNAPNADLEYDIGVALYAHGEPPEGALHLRRATTLNPKFVSAFSNLGVVLEKLEDYRAAHDAYQMALRCQPTNVKLQAMLKRVNGKLDQTKHFDFAAVEAVEPATLLPTDAAKAPVVRTGRAATGKLETRSEVQAPVSVVKPPIATSGGTAPSSDKHILVDPALMGITTSLTNTDAQPTAPGDATKIGGAAANTGGTTYGGSKNGNTTASGSTAGNGSVAGTSAITTAPVTVAPITTPAEPVLAPLPSPADVSTSTGTKAPGSMPVDSLPATDGAVDGTKNAVPAAAPH